MIVWLHDTAENYRASIINTDTSIDTLTDKGVTFMSERERDIFTTILRQDRFSRGTRRTAVYHWDR